MSPLCDRKGIIVLLQYGRIAFYIDEKTRPRAKCRPSSVTEIRREELNEKNKITREDGMAVMVSSFAFSVPF